MKISAGSTVKEVKAMFVGVNGEPVKIWDKEHGVINQELFDRAIKAVIANG